MKNFGKPILIAGLVCGFLSGIPGVQCFNCCCLWVVLCGGLASYLLVSSATDYPTDGDGAIAGMGAGGLGGFIAGLLNYAMVLAQGQEKYQEALDQALSQMQNLPPEMQQFVTQIFKIGMSGSPFLYLLQTIMYVFLFGAVGALGGLIGVRIFRPRRFGPFPPGSMPGYPYPGPGGGPGLNYAVQYAGPAGPAPPPPANAVSGGPMPMSQDPLEQKIAMWLLAVFQRETGITVRDPLVMARLQDVASKARKQLLVQEEVMIDVPFLAADASGPKHLNTTLNRSMFPELATGANPASPTWGNQ